jgi:hypothetical protein
VILVHYKEGEGKAGHEHMCGGKAEEMPEK